MKIMKLRPIMLTLVALPVLAIASGGCAVEEESTAQTEGDFLSEHDIQAVAAIREAVADVDQSHVTFSVCDKIEGAGELCSEDAPCAEGLECVPSEDGETAACEATQQECRAATIEEMPAPDNYPRPRVDSGFSLGGTEFWQRWSGGESPTFSYSVGTDLGRRCMTAAALRFEAIMADPPEEIVAMRDNSNWRGSFFNWVDDYSHESAHSDASGSKLWAWRTSLVKWISQTAKDGSCYLPTRQMVLDAAASCAAKAEANDGEIQGCRAQ